MCSASISWRAANTLSCGSGAGGLPMPRLASSAGQAQNLGFGGGVRVVDIDMHQEAVQLCLRQRIGSLLFYRVLRGHHQEQIGQFVGLAADAHLALCHCFQQGRLYFGGRAVDLVRQHQVVKHGPLLEVETRLLWPVYLRAGDVTRQQVRGKLDAVKTAFDAIRQGFDGPCLGESRERLPPAGARPPAAR